MYMASSILLFRLLVVLSIILFPSVSARNLCEGDKSIAGHCTTLTFTDDTSLTLNAPSTSNCQDSCHSTLSEAGNWIVSFNDQPGGDVQHMVGSKCGFSAGRVLEEGSSYRFEMHNQDIVEIIDEVTKRFGTKHGGKVGANGTMECDGKKAVWWVGNNVD